MIHQKKVLLENLGYDINKPSCNYFIDVVEEVATEMNNRPLEEVKEMVSNKKSYIYTELACFCYEIGLNNFIKELNEFHDNRISKDNSINKQIFGEEEPTLDEAIIKVSSYLNNTKSKEHNKVMVKKRKFIPSFN